MKTLKEILNESAHDSSIEKQNDNIDAKADEGSSKDLKAISAGMFTKRTLIRSMKHSEGVIQLASGKQYTIFNPKSEDQDTEGMFQDDMVFAIDADGNEVKVEYKEITSYNETYHEDEAGAPRRMTYDDAHQPKTKMELMAAVKRELRSMKVADVKASYQYIKAAHCNTRESMHGMGTKKDTLMAMMKDLKGMKASALRASYEYIKASHCGPHEGAHEDEMVNAGAHRDDLKHPKPQPVMASHCTEETEITEAKSMDFNRTSRFITELSGSLTKGSKLNREVNKTLGGNYDRDFKEMQDSMDDIYDAWQDIEAEIEMNEGVEISEAINFSKVPDDQLIKWIKVLGLAKNRPKPPWTDYPKDMAAAEKEAKKRRLTVEAVELEEMKTKDDDLAVMIYDFIGADTEGLPLKTLIMQAVGKYFGSQKVDGPVGG